MCNAVKLPSAPRLKFQNPGQNYSKSEEAKIKTLLDNDPVEAHFASQNILLFGNPLHC